MYVRIVTSKPTRDLSNGLDKTIICFVIGIAWNSFFIARDRNYRISWLK
jgi:hypothetical protein